MTVQSDPLPGVTTASNAVNPETSENVDILCSNPHTDRRDITQEELDKSCMRMLGELENAEDAIWNIKYAYNDVNNDGVPELFIGYNYIGEGYIHMFVYDGEKYTPASFKSRFTLEGRNERTVGGQNILICPEENLIFTDYLMGMSESQILEIDKGSTYRYEANYSGFLEMKQQRLEFEQAAERKAAALYKKDLAWMLRGARARSTKQKAHIQRFEALRDMKGRKRTE